MGTLMVRLVGPEAGLWCPGGGKTLPSEQASLASMGLKHSQRGSFSDGCRSCSGP